MWQPEQPSSQTVATLTFLMPRTPPVRAQPCADRSSVRFTISSTALPFSASAPVGHACTHLPQLVQLVASPHGWFSSETMRAWMPRDVTSHTCAPSISAHTRTQRVHRMQRLWSSTKRGWRQVHRQLGIVVGEAHAGDAQRSTPWPAVRSGRWRRRPRRCDCARPAAAPPSCGGSASAAASWWSPTCRPAPAWCRRETAGRCRKPPPCTAGRRRRRSDLPGSTAWECTLPARARRLQDGLPFRGVHQFAVDADRKLFLRQDAHSSLARRRRFDVAAQAAAGFLVRLFRAQPDNHLFDVLDALAAPPARRQRAGGSRWVLRRRLLVVEARGTACSQRSASISRSSMLRAACLP